MVGGSASRPACLKRGLGEGRLLAFLAAGVAWSLPADARAQAPPTIPQPPTREQVEPPEQRQVERRPRLTTETGIEQAPCALADPAYRDIRFTLRRAEFDNLRAVPAEALEASWRPYVGISQPLAAICAIRDAAATMLRDA